MNAKQIQKFVLRYLEATGCQIIEKHPAFVTVKLSPEADKRLTNRPYYWSFVERTGAPAETMTMKFVFDPDRLPVEQADGKEKNAGAGRPGTPGPAADTILGRYFGVTFAAPAGPGRIPTETVTFGSRRLEQIFTAVKSDGKFVQLFEEPDFTHRRSVKTSSYASWLVANVKVEFVCDMKRDELHSVGLNLSTGRLVTGMHTMLLTKKLSPRLPPNVYVDRPKLTLARAMAMIEQHIEHTVSRYDHRWAAAACKRLAEELELVDRFYGEQEASAADDERKAAIRAQWNNRKRELEWQYRPRIRATVVNGGIFHLRADPDAD